MKKSLLLIACFILVFQMTHAQWQPVNGPYGGTVTNLVANGQDLFALTQQQGVFRSSDNAATWTHKSSGITSLMAQCSTVKGNTLYIGTQAGLFSSSDNGNTWNTVFINGSAVSPIIAIASNSQSLFIIRGDYGNNSLYKSNDDGGTWTELFPMGYYYSLGVQGDSVFFGSGGYLYRSYDNGNSFSQLDPVFACLCFAFDGSTMYTTDGTGGVYRSTDHGDNWTLLTNGMTTMAAFNLTVNAGKLYAGCKNGQLYYPDPDGEGGVFMTADAGSHWTCLGLKGYTVNSVIVSGNRIIAGTNLDGIFISDNNGTTWSTSTNNLVRLSVSTVAQFGSTLYESLNTAYYSYFPEPYGYNMMSSDAGITWVKEDSGMTYPVINAYADGGSFILAGGWQLYKSSDHGVSWKMVFFPESNINTLLISGTKVIAGTAGAGIFVSDDQCTTWHSSNNGLDNYDILSMTQKGNILFAGTEMGVYRSTDLGSTWVSAHLGIEAYWITALTANSNYLFAVGSSTTSAIFRSADNGNSWEKTTDLFPGSNYFSASTLAASGNIVVAGTTDLVNQVLYSNDNGSTWSVAKSGLPGGYSVPGVIIHDSLVYAGLVYNNAFSQNGGLWKRQLIDFVPFLLGNDTLVMEETLVT